MNTHEDYPTAEKFELTFQEERFKKKDILNINNVKCKITSIPKKHYNKWYWRILNFLTFKLFFNVKYSYTVQVIN